MNVPFSLTAGTLLTVRLPLLLSSAAGLATGCGVGVAFGSGVVLGAVGIYEPFAKWAGAGATVPLTGFGNLLAKGVRDAVAEKGVLGAFTGGFEAGAAGICAAIFFGLLVAMCFKSKDKQ